MIDHLGVQVANVEASLAFYLRTFAAIGLREEMRFQDGDFLVVGLSGADGIPHFWLSPAAGAECVGDVREILLAGDHALRRADQTLASRIFAEIGDQRTDGGFRLLARRLLISRRRSVINMIGDRLLRPLLDNGVHCVSRPRPNAELQNPFASAYIMDCWMDTINRRRQG